MVFLDENSFQNDISTVAKMVKMSKVKGAKGGQKIEMKGCD